MDTLFIETDLGKVFLRTKGKGKPLFFIHGLPLDSRIWSSLIEELSNDFYCIALDLPGLGLSEPLSKSGSDKLSLEDISRLVLLVLKSLCLEEVNILAHSMGGYVLGALLDIEHEDSERFIENNVTNLILCSTRTSIDSKEKKSARIAHSDLIKSGNFTPYILEQISACSTENEDDRTKGVSKIISDNVRQSVSSLITAVANRKDTTQAFFSHKEKIHLLVGAKDEIFKGEMYALEQSLGCRKVHTFLESAHMPFLDQEKDFAEYLRCSL